LAWTLATGALLVPFANGVKREREREARQSMGSDRPAAAEEEEEEGRRFRKEKKNSNLVADDLVLVFLDGRRSRADARSRCTAVLRQAGGRGRGLTWP